MRLRDSKHMLAHLASELTNLPEAERIRTGVFESLVRTAESQYLDNSVRALSIMLYISARFSPGCTLGKLFHDEGSQEWLHDAYDVTEAHSLPDVFDRESTIISIRTECLLKTASMIYIGLEQLVFPWPESIDELLGHHAALLWVKSQLFGDFDDLYVGCDWDQ